MSVWSRTREDISAIRKAVPGAIARGASYTVSVLSDTAQATFTNVISREAYYAGNMAGPSIMPDAQAIVDAYWRGYIGEGVAQTALSALGIGWAPGMGRPNDSAGTYCWRNIIHMQRPSMDIGAATSLWLQGLITDDNYASRLNKAGLVTARDRALAMSQTPILSADDAQRFRLQGLATDDELRASLRREHLPTQALQAPYMAQRPTLDESELRYAYWSANLPFDVISAHMDMLGYAGPTTDGMAPSPQARAQQGFSDLFGSRAGQQFHVERGYGASQALALYWRGELSAAQLSGEIASDGIVSQTRQDSWLRAQRPIPDYASLVSFAVREAWDEASVARFGYDLEFPEPFRFWMAQQGWDWGQQIPDGQGGMIPAVNWPQAYWRVHWATMSPTQAYEAYHRLRPDRIARFQVSVPGVTPFTFDDLLTALKISDYPAPVRKWLAAMSHTVMDIRQVRMAYQFGIRDRAWLIANLLDRGMVLEDANSLADIEDERNAPMNGAVKLAMRRQTLKRMAAQIEHGYDVGTYSRSQADSALAGLGIGRADADMRLLEIEIAHNISIAQAAIKSLRSAYFAGEYSTAEIGVALGGYNLQQSAISRYVALWTLQRNQRRRMATTSMILGWVAKGQMAPEVAQQRLANLGWYAPDALMAIQSAQLMADKIHAAQQRAADATKHKQIAAVEKVVHQASAADKAARATLKKLTPLSSLKDWGKKGVVSNDWIRARMVAMGYPVNIIQGYLESWGLEPIPPTPAEAVPAAPAAETPPDQSRIASTAQRIGNVPPPTIP